MTDCSNPRGDLPSIEATLTSAPRSVEGDLQLRFIVHRPNSISGRQSKHGLLHFNTMDEVAEYLYELAKHFDVERRDLVLGRGKGLEGVDLSDDLVLRDVATQ